MDSGAGVRALEGGEIFFSGLELKKKKKKTLDSQANRRVIVLIMISRLTSSEINFILWNH
jgi:hypothetical protein